MEVETIINNIENWDSLDILDDGDMHIKLVDTIIKKRLELGLSQRDLAKLSGVKQPAIARFETYNSKPTITTLYKLAKPLGLKIKLSFIEKEIETQC